jgi:hypothetical protein
MEWENLLLILNLNYVMAEIIKQKKWTNENKYQKHNGRDNLTREITGDNRKCRLIIRAKVYGPPKY